MNNVTREDIPRGEFLETNYHSLRRRDSVEMNVTSILEEELSEFMLQIGGVVSKHVMDRKKYQKECLIVFIITVS